MEEALVRKTLNNFSPFADEKEKYDPIGFRDAVIAGFDKTGGDLEGISKYLDTAGNKLDYRRYGEVLFDVLIAGGLLVPGGSISLEGETPRTDCCMFNAADDMESMRQQEQVIIAAGIFQRLGNYAPH